MFTPQQKPAAAVWHDVQLHAEVANHIHASSHSWYIYYFVMRTPYSTVYFMIITTKDKTDVKTFQSCKILSFTNRSVVFWLLINP